MYQILCYTWKNSYMYSNNTNLYNKKNYYNRQDRNKIKIDSSLPKDYPVNIIVNKDIIQKIDESIEYTEKQIISLFCL
jgi:hypothetical protein